MFGLGVGGGSGRGSGHGEGFEGVTLRSMEGSGFDEGGRDLGGLRDGGISGDDGGHHHTTPTTATATATRATWDKEKGDLTVSLLEYSIDNYYKHPVTQTHT